MSSNLKLDCAQLGGRICSCLNRRKSQTTDYPAGQNYLSSVENSPPNLRLPQWETSEYRNGDTHHILSGVGPHRPHVIEEKGVKMKLTVIDTPGFGDQINNDNCWEPIEKYISEQYEKFLKEEANISRKKRIPDTRVHCCLYFISPTGHSLRPLDVEFMKRLGKIMNIIPVIAKADTMTLEERHEFKLRVRKELEANAIEFYPQREFDEDMEDKIENDKIRETMPLAIIGSDTEYQINGKRVLGRKTPWGIIEVENVTHCEFPLLRDLIVRTHLQDLKEVTHNIFYETYRAKCLNENGNLANDAGDVHESNL
ncbi:neuronal-specific septin-3 isoform X2 [Scyliorhinus torazame]|uniref:neuronal-specific septin-3 isoform X2 n=1 Tax=Scyliorhinus torazame TaxID=75743 RepID=UPI003B5B7E28